MRLPLDSIYITQPYNPPYHKGVDLRAKEGTKLLNTEDGFVKKIAWNEGGYGWYIDIEHAGYVDRFGHLKERPTWNNGDFIRENEVVGLSGNTGRSTAPHLHYEVFTNYLLKIRTNPLQYLEDKMNELAHKLEGQTILVPDDHGKWYWICRGQKCWIPDHPTGWAYGLLPEDAVGVAKKDADTIPDGKQLQYKEGNFYRLVQNIWDNKQYLT